MHRFSMKKNSHQSGAACTCDGNCSCHHTEHRTNWLEVGGMLLLALSVFELFKRLNVLALPGYTQEAVSLSAVFSIGLVAAFSTCMALVGGLLLSVTAAWTQSHTVATHYERFRPSLFFNIGRLIGYFLLGGIIGWIGQAFTLTPRLSGLLTIMVAVVMVLLGLSILQIIPKRYCRVPLPSSWHVRLKQLSQSRNPAMPFVIGALTFFIPCGFTQSMQLLALSSGNALSGGLIMLVFALGTLPSLLGIGAASAAFDGRAGKIFLRFAGAFVLLLGLSNFQNGLLLSGVDAKNFFGRSAMTDIAPDPYVTIDPQNRQIIALYASNTGFSPNHFTVRPNMDTWVYAVSPDGVSNCASILTAPLLNISVPIQQGGNWLHLGTLTKSTYLTCSMGKFRVDIDVASS